MFVLFVRGRAKRRDFLVIFSCFNPSPCGYSQPHPNPLLEEREEEENVLNNNFATEASITPFTGAKECLREGVQSRE